MHAMDKATETEIIPETCAVWGPQSPGRDRSCPAFAGLQRGVMLGRIKHDARINAVHPSLIALIGVIVLGLVRPEILERLKRVKLSGVQVRYEMTRMPGRGAEP